MSDFVITVEGLSKRYRIGRREGYRDLRETLTEPVYLILARFRSLFRRPGVQDFSALNGENTIWALRDVGFEVKKGEVVGIIGRNGAGKTTLLKILSRITEPTGGCVEIQGRVGSLLEVGTGFHPELTGRENIYLNGAILGMTRGEIRRRFDEIVTFADIEKFLDTPAKHYSTGMYMRLAFAVAAHLDTDILLVDEVLAVGDMEFQRKCLGKMSDVARQGRTVLLVSHNLSTIRALCGSGILLERGSLKAVGKIEDVVGSYLTHQSIPKSQFSDKNRRFHSDTLRIVHAATYRDGHEISQFAYGEELEIRISIYADVKYDSISVEAVIRDAYEAPIICLSSGLTFGQLFSLDTGYSCASCKVPRLPLAEGRYFLDLSVGYAGLHFLDYLECALWFEVTYCDPAGTGFPYKQAHRQGAVYVPARFQAFREVPE